MEFYLSDEIEWQPASGLLDNNQKALIRLRAHVKVSRFETLPTFVNVDLQGSSVVPSINGKLVKDDAKTGRYWFTERVDVEISLGDAEHTEVYTSSPPAQQGSYSVTSSTQIGINLSAGTFGETLVNQPGITYAVGTSFSRNLSDFRIQPYSVHNVAKRTYVMSASRGGEYNEPLDLYDHSVSLFNNWHPLADLAIAEFGLADNVLFMSRTNNDSGERELKIAVTHHLRGVYGIKPALLEVIGVPAETRTVETFQRTLSKTHKIKLADAFLLS
ncbi:hypothetical protein [Microvirga rosea]|uniref:hypothetical protein n=1 Tax=Microvirga rosea TaxID=2715425 RepID=UPI001D0B19C5|nr:hypothetical protein [Microvirga rosea]MCB8823517.1 hypothetical protein [Microvirga rosea]